MSNNKIISFCYAFITILLVFALSGCSNKGNKKVGLLLHQMEGRWFTDVDYLKKHAINAGIDLVIKIADGNENIQLRQAQELVNEGVEVILIVAVSQNTAAGIVRTAHKANLKVIAYDRMILNSDLDYLITYDYRYIGEMLAQYSKSRVPKGNYVLLYGDASDANARLMREGEEKYLANEIETGSINVVYKTFIEGWLDTNAKHEMGKVLSFSGKKIDVVIANNDVIARAILDVFDEYGLEHPKVITGQDCMLESCQSIYQGRQTMSVYKSTNQTAEEAIKLAVKIINGEKIPKANGFINNRRKDVPTFFLTPVVVDKTNLSSTVVADGMYAMEQIIK
jgi:D-xylose transport system substrate-binding protein